MSEKARQEFNDKVRAAREAVDRFAVGRIKGDWFVRDLDNQLRKAVDELLDWGIERKPATQSVGIPDILDAEFLE